jgi:hypothetical protein
MTTTTLLDWSHALNTPAVEAMAKARVLGNDLTLIHVCACSAHEFQLMAEQGVSVRIAARTFRNVPTRFTWIDCVHISTATSAIGIGTSSAPALAKTIWSAPKWFTAAAK